MTASGFYPNVSWVNLQSANCCDQLVGRGEGGCAEDIPDTGLLEERTWSRAGGRLTTFARGCWLELRWSRARFFAASGERG